MRAFITSTGTDSGKTFVAAAIASQARQLSRRVNIYKPVMTGFDASRTEESDAGVLLKSLDLPATDKNIERVSPWRFAAPLAPTMAASAENRSLDFDALVDYSRKALAGPEDVVLIEGIGGVMVPLTQKHTVLDWMAALGTPALLVAGNYLGALSHTLTALAALEQRGIPLLALIVNESEDSTVPLEDTADEFASRINTPIIALARRKGKEGWRDVAGLRTLFSSPAGGEYSFS